MNDIFCNLKQSPLKWERVEIGELCDIFGGIPAPQIDAPYKNGEIPFVRMADLGKFHRTPNLNKVKDKLNKEFVEKKKIRLIKKNSILIPRSGSVRWNHRAILGFDACIVSHICALIPKISKVDTEYLYYTISNVDMKQIMKRTTGLDSISFTDLKKLKIPLPPIKIQKKIGQILRKIDDIYSQRISSVNIFEQLLEPLFVEFFKDELENTNQKTYKLKDVVKIVGGGTPSKKKSNYWDGNIPWASPKDMKKLFLNDTKDHITSQAIEKSSTNLIPSKSVLVVNRSGILKKYLPLAINKIPMAINQDLKAFIPNDEILSEFLLTYLKIISPKLLSKVRSVTAHNISLDEFTILDIPLPPIKKQKKFSEIMYKLEDIQKKIERQNYRHQLLFSSLQQDAFHGKFDP